MLAVVLVALRLLPLLGLALHLLRLPPLLLGRTLVNPVGLMIKHIF